MWHFLYLVTKIKALSLQLNSTKQNPIGMTLLCCFWGSVRLVRSIVLPLCLIYGCEKVYNYDQMDLSLALSWSNAFQLRSALRFTLLGLYSLSFEGKHHASHSSPIRLANPLVIFCSLPIRLAPCIFLFVLFHHLSLSLSLTLSLHTSFYEGRKDGGKIVLLFLLMVLFFIFYFNFFWLFFLIFIFIF